MELTESIIVEVNKRVARGYGQDVANGVTLRALEQIKVGKLKIEELLPFLRWSLTTAKRIKMDSWYTTSKLCMVPLPLDLPGYEPGIEGRIDARRRLTHLAVTYPIKLDRLIRYNDEKCNLDGGRRFVKFIEVSRERIRQHRRELKAELERFETFKKEVLK